MKRVSVACFAFLAAATGAAAEAPKMSAPQGAFPMIDGRVSPGEWDDAGRLVLSPDVTLMAKQVGDYVFVAVKIPQPLRFGVNLYVAGADGRQVNLHASAKLGERVPAGETWPDWTWWTHQGWTANVAQFDSFEPRNFRPGDVKEFQIRRDRFAGDVWRLRLDTEGPLVTALPEAARPFDTLGWIELDLR